MPSVRPHRGGGRRRESRPDGDPTPCVRRGAMRQRSPAAGSASQRAVPGTRFLRQGHAGREASLARFATPPWPPAPGLPPVTGGAVAGRARPSVLSLGGPALLQGREAEGPHALPAPQAAPTCTAAADAPGLPLSPVLNAKQKPARAEMAMSC